MSELESIDEAQELLLKHKKRVRNKSQFFRMRKQKLARKAFTKQLPMDRNSVISD